MNKKLLVVSILCVFAIIAISYASAINTTTVIESKESPLFGIRTRRAIKERIGDVLENIKTKYIGERVFFLPFRWLRGREESLIRHQLGEKTGEVLISLCKDTCDMSYCGPEWTCIVDPECYTYPPCRLP